MVTLADQSTTLNTVANIVEVVSQVTERLTGTSLAAKVEGNSMSGAVLRDLIAARVGANFAHLTTTNQDAQ